MDLITEFDFLPNCARFPLNICNWCGMPTEDAYSSGNLVLSHFGTCNCSNVEINLSWACLVSGLLSFEHPSVLLFCFPVCYNRMFKPGCVIPVVTFGTWPCTHTQSGSPSSSPLVLPSLSESFLHISFVHFYTHQIRTQLEYGIKQGPVLYCRSHPWKICNIADLPRQICNIADLPLGGRFATLRTFPLSLRIFPGGRSATLQTLAHVCKVPDSHVRVYRKKGFFFIEDCTFYIWRFMIKLSYSVV